MRDGHSFEAVKNRLARNTHSAAEEVSARHFERIVRLVRAQIGRRYQSKIDAEDIANSVLKSFFLRYADGRDGLSDWQGLWCLLSRIAVNKLRNRVRDLRRKKRDVGLEVPVEAGAYELGGDDLDRPAAGGEPAASPDEAVVIRDLCDHLMRDYTEDKRRVIELSLQGYPVGEIADATRLSDRTVCRIRDQFKRRLEEESDAAR